MWYYNYPHPLEWLRLFEHDLCVSCLYEVEEKATDELSIRGLAKLLMYGNFVKARSFAESKTFREVVEGELDLYPYSRKKEFISPYFTPVDLSSVDLNLENTTMFRPSLTDAGICQVRNGNSLFSTFTSSVRTDDLKYSLDPKTESIKPNNITGTGKISQTTMWLDAGNMGMKNLNFGGRRKREEGSLILAIGAWQTYYDVRINQLDLRAGTDVVVKIKPVVHSVSDDFKTLTLDERKCRFPDEIKVYV